MGFIKSYENSLAAKPENYLYETNVGAGLLATDNKIIASSGENITKIKGVFSGTLSYLFNNYSAKDAPFSKILKEAIDKWPHRTRSARGFGNRCGSEIIDFARELICKTNLEEIGYSKILCTRSFT
jgi:aspartokinase/homoserine dehydrogenase 1